MRISQVAAQLYTVRDSIRTAPALAATARRLRRIGYEAVQLSMLGPIPPAEVVRIMAGEGLAICSTHEPAHTILDEPDQAIETVRQLGCRLTAYPFPEGVDFGNADAIAAWVSRLDAVGARFRAAGLILGYHNHDLEFRRFGGATVLDYLYAHTAPEHLVGEPDTYWVQVGGGDCVEWCRKLRGRMPFIHLKDYAMTPERRPASAEIGRGNLPFARIIAEAERSGCQWFIVEQDACPGDPFESLRLSFDYLRDNLTA